MPDLSALPLPVKLLLAAVAFVAVIALLATLFAPRTPRPPYETREFLSPAELLFFRALEQSVPDDVYLFAKVRIGDLLSVVEGTKDSRNWFAKIGQKHVDFMLADKDAVRPLLVIELDDASHNRADRRERDQFVDAALDAAGLPILRVPCAQSYSPDALAQAIQSHLPTRTR